MTTRHLLVAVAAALATACGSVSPGDLLNEAVDRATGGSAEQDRAERLRDELDELGIELTDEELAEAESLLTGDADGEAVVSIDGMAFETRGVSCGARSDFYEVTAIGVDDRDVQVRFSHASQDDYFFDDGSVNLFTEEGTWRSRDREQIIGDRDHAIGTIVVYEDPFAAEGERGSSFTVDVEVRCAPGVEVREHPGVTAAAEAAAAAAEEVVFPDDFDIDPAQGFGEALPGIEVPDEPGTGILTIDGVAIEMAGWCNTNTYRELSEVNPDNPASWFAWQANFSDASGSGVSLDGTDLLLIRRLGSFVGDGPPRAIEEFANLQRGVDNSRRYAYEVDARGQVIDPDGEGRSTERVVSITEDGVITMRADFRHHPDPDLAGEVTFGGRCDGFWSPQG